MNSCLICNRINQIIQGNNPYFVTELTTGFVVLGDYQFYQGYTLFLSKNHKKELHELDQKTKNIYLQEMAIVAEAVYGVFKPEKLNYELLGNSDKHLHWHIIPRYLNDPDPTRPIWVYPKEKRCNEQTQATTEFMQKYIPKLVKSIQLLTKELNIK